MAGSARKRAVFEGDVLDVAEEIEAEVSALASDPGLSRAAERRVQVAHEEAIDPHRAGDDGRRYPLGALAIARVHHRGKPVLRAVGEIDRVRFRVERLPG